MKIAIAISSDRSTVSSHAGQTRQWLCYDLSGHLPDAPLPEPALIELSKTQTLHHFKDDGPHPLDGTDIVVAASAGDGFIRHMQKRGATVLLTGEKDPAVALRHILAGEHLPDPRFDVTTVVCKLRDLFSRH